MALGLLCGQVFDPGQVPFLKRILSRRKDLETVRKEKSVYRFFAIAACVGLGFRSLKTARFSEKYPDCPTRCVEKIVSHGLPEQCAFEVGTLPPVKALLNETALLFSCARHMLFGNSVRYEVGFRWCNQTRFNRFVQDEMCHMLSIDRVEVGGETAFQELVLNNQPENGASADEEDPLDVASDLATLRTETGYPEAENPTLPKQELKKMRCLSVALTTIMTSSDLRHQPVAASGLSNIAFLLLGLARKYLEGLDQKASEGLGGFLLNTEYFMVYPSAYANGFHLTDSDILEGHIIDGLKVSVPHAVTHDWGGACFQASGILKYENLAEGPARGYSMARSRLKDLLLARSRDLDGSQLLPPDWGG